MNNEAGFNFKSYVGTALVSALYAAYSLVFYYQRTARGGLCTLPADAEERIRRLLSRVMNLVGERPRSDAVLTSLEADRAAGTGPYLELSSWFHECVRHPGAEHGLRYLRAFRAVLSFETGRLYTGWFVDEAPLRLEHDALVGVIELCERLRPDEELCDMAGSLDSYLAGAGVGADAIARARAEARREAMFSTGSSPGAPADENGRP